LIIFAPELKIKKMNKLLLSVLTILLMVSCSSNEQYLLKGTLEGAEGEMIYLQEYTGGDRVNIDSTTLLNGTFEFAKGSVSFPSMHYLTVNGKRGTLAFFLENSEIMISGHVDSIYNAVAEGSATHDLYKEYGEGLNPYYERNASLYEEYRAASQEGHTELANEILEKRQELNEETRAYQVGFIKSHTASPVTPDVLRSISYELETDELDEFLGLLDESLMDMPVVVNMKDRVEALRKVEIGQVAPDFTQDDVDGNPVTLSEIKGHKLLLIDFWAAWCGPCRRENPHVVAVYNEYNEAGFDVLGVSLDNDREAWLKAIEDDLLPWTQVSDLGGWGNVVAKQYAVNSIPANFLLDAEGKILAKGLRGEKLKEKVAELLAE